MAVPAPATKAARKPAAASPKPADDKDAKAKAKEAKKEAKEKEGKGKEEAKKKTGPKRVSWFEGKEGPDSFVSWSGGKSFLADSLKTALCFGLEGKGPTSFVSSQIADPRPCVICSPRPHGTCTLRGTGKLSPRPTRAKMQTRFVHPNPIAFCNFLL